jgi:signal peptidase I
MIQFFKFNPEIITESEFKIISGREAVKFFIKRAFYLFMFIYSTLFLAVALPFVKTPFIPVYFIGSMATAFFILRFTNEIIKFIKYSGGSIKISPDFIEILSGKKNFKIAKSDITYLEHNLQGNLVIREKFNSLAFPLNLLSVDDRIRLIANFQDMAEKRTNVYKKVWEMIDAVAVAMVLAVHIIQYIVQAYYIPTGSMEDTLKIGDHLFVEKITFGPQIPMMLGMDKPLHLKFFGIREPQRGDIVIFRPPHETDKDYIKRLIALPGDKFEIIKDSVYINGEKTDEPYTKGITTYSYFGESATGSIEGIVPAGKVIVLGDNRQNSQDSRYFGYLDIDKIKGKAFIRYWNTGAIFKGEFFSDRFGFIK